MINNLVHFTNLPFQFTYDIFTELFYPDFFICISKLQSTYDDFDFELL